MATVHPALSTTTNPAPAPRSQRPNYNAIHASPLPLAIHPIPAFLPHNPFSILRVAYIYLSHLLFPPLSHTPYSAYYDSLTQSIHVTDPVAIRALWEKGFFGKGSLSRSEPEWLKRMELRAREELEERREGKGKGKGEMTSAEVTRKRREIRREGKRERARKEAEAVEEQLRSERERERKRGEVVGDGALLEEWVQSTVEDEAAVMLEKQTNEGVKREESPGQTEEPRGDGHNGFNGRAEATNGTPAGHTIQSSPPSEVSLTTTERKPLSGAPITSTITIPTNQEHLQLTPSEAFFLHYGLGVLDIFRSSTLTSSPPSRSLVPFSSPLQTPLTTPHLLNLLRHNSTFPPTTPSQPLSPDDPFLLTYTVYHHFRSLGWVVRPGTKFAVDFLLDYRGPAFSHAEFAIMIVPEYSGHAWWESEKGRKWKEERGRRGKDWWWLHASNRVQAQVRKCLVLVYVTVPPPVGWDEEEGVGEGKDDVGKLLRGYRVREFVLKRWTANRNRD